MERIGGNVHIIYLTHQEAIAKWVFTQLGEFSDIESMTFVSNTESLIESARNHRSYSVLIGQLRTRDYCDAEPILRAEGNYPRRRILCAPVLTSEFLRWASEQKFDSVIDMVAEQDRIGQVVHDALTSVSGFTSINFPLISGTIPYRDYVDEVIVRMVAVGYTNVEIANKVNLSLQTIRNRISRLLDVSGARNRTHLAAMYLIPFAANMQRDTSAIEWTQESLSEEDDDGQLTHHHQ